MSFELRQFRQCPGTHAGLNVPCGSAEDWIIISLRFIQTFFLQCGPVLETLIPQGLKLFQPLGLAWAWPGLAWAPESQPRFTLELMVRILAEKVSFFTGEETSL